MKEEINKKLENDKNKPTVAPGMRDFVEKSATKKEVENKDYTRVTTLSWDETD